MRIHPLLAVSLACLPLFACDKREGITVREEPVEVAPPAAPAQPAVAPAMPKNQIGPGQTMWAGAVPADGQEWLIFKAIAPSPAIAAHAAEMESILKLNDGTLPVGWTREEVSAQAAQFGRVATFRSPAPEITLAVNQTGGSISSNINRWRGQAGLAELPEADAEAQVKKLENGGWTVEIAGKAQEQSKPSDWDAIDAQRDAAKAAKAAKTAASLSFALPEGWAKVPASNDMRLAQFSAGAGDQACEVAITRFPGTVGKELGPTLDNLNRWRAQVGLAPWTELPAASQAVPMEISGAPGAVVQVAAAEGEAATDKAALVAFVADEKNTYFIKLTGPTQAVEAQLVPMLAFLKSLKLPMEGAPAPLPADLKLLPKIGK